MYQHVYNTCKVHKKLGTFDTPSDHCSLAPIVSGLWGHDDLDPVLTKRIARAGA